MIQRVNPLPNIPVNSLEPTQRINNNLDDLRQKSFHQILNDKLQSQEITFSAHALNRLEQRNIVVDEQVCSKLGNAIEQIAQKGGRESLIMMDDVAYVVSIPNKTVITALDNSNQSIFTNIDSAMIVDRGKI